jgi:GAF domain-containing protein
MNINLKSEEERLIAMRKLLELPFNRDENVKKMTEMAAFLLGTPVSMVTLLDKDIQYIITSHGLPLEKMPRATSFCTHAIQNDELMVVPDAQKDERFKDMPLVKQQPNVRFYAGMPLKYEGCNVGTLCVFHDKPLNPTPEQLNCLNVLAQQVSNVMTLNSSLTMIKTNYDHIEKQYSALREIAFIQSHEVRAPLCNAIGITELIKAENPSINQDHIVMLEDALTKLDQKIHKIVDNTVIN